MEASSFARPSVGTRLRQPAYGEHTKHPEVEAQYESADQETAADELGRWAQWPFLGELALLEIGWLVALAYTCHRFVLSPVFG